MAAIAGVVAVCINHVFHPTLLTRRTVDCCSRNASQCLLLHDYDSVSVKVVFWCWTWFNDNLHSVPMLLPINVRVWPLFFSILILFLVWIHETRFVRLFRALRSTVSTFPVSRRFTERESRLSPRDTRNSNSRPIIKIAPYTLIMSRASGASN